MKKAFLCLGFLSFYAFTLPNLSIPSSNEQVGALKQSILDMKADPQLLASKFAKKFRNAPISGWEISTLTELKALDLMGYFYALEKNQFYASAGRWDIPDHPRKETYYEFYSKVLNPKGGAYSSGVLQEALRLFAEEFLRQVIIDFENHKKTRLLGILLAGDREFWTKEIAKSFQYMSQDLIIELLRSVNLHPSREHKEFLFTIREGVFKRESKSAIRNIMQAWLAHALVEGNESVLFQLTTIGLDEQVNLECAQIFQEEAQANNITWPPF